MIGCGATAGGGWRCVGTGCLAGGAVCMHDAAAPRTVRDGFRWTGVVAPPVRMPWADESGDVLGDLNAAADRLLAEPFVSYPPLLNRPRDGEERRSG